MNPPIGDHPRLSCLHVPPLHQSPQSPQQALGPRLAHAPPTPMQTCTLCMEEQKRDGSGMRLSTRPGATRLKAYVRVWDGSPAQQASLAVGM